MGQAPTTATRRHDLEQTSADVALRALAEDDAQAARDAIPGILEEERPIHDLYGDMCASFLTFIADKLGEDAVEEAWRYVADDVWKPVLMAFKEQPQGFTFSRTRSKDSRSSSRAIGVRRSVSPRAGSSLKLLTP